MNTDCLENYFLQVYSNNDSGWYEKIAANGYPNTNDINNKESADYAFFPVYPITGKLISNLFKIKPRLSLLLLTTVASFLMMITFYYFATEYLGNENKAFWCSLVLIFFPHHFYFSMIYTESFFVFFSVLCFYSILSKKNILFMIASSLLVLTRINGVIYIIPLLIFYNRDNIKKWFVISRYYIFIPMIISLTSYLIILKLKFGSFFAFKIASENNWAGNPQNPFNALIRGVTESGDHLYLKYNAIYSIVFLLLSILFLVKKQYSFFILSILSILFPLYEGSTISQPRFISVIFPFSLLIGSFVYSFRYRLPLIIGILLMQLLTFGFWIITHPLSF
jgi:Gpi18-like mannosyltransferase